MMCVNLHKYGTSIVIYDPHSLVNRKQMSDVMNSYLKEMDGSLNNTNLDRVLAIDNYYLVAPYGCLIRSDLLHFVKRYLEITNVNINDQTEEVLPKHIKDLLDNSDNTPTVLNHKASQCGGTIEDSNGIDPGIESLCNAINSFDGITTFSSCEGHPSNNSCTAYVLFNIDKFFILDHFTTIFDTALEKLFNEYKLTLNEFEWTLMFGRSRWPNQPITYFEFRLKYNANNQENIFMYLNKLSKYIKG